MQDAKKNKGFSPHVDPPAPEGASPQIAAEERGDLGGKVRIRFRQGRGAEGVTVEADGTALVDAVTARYLMSIGYAEEVT